MQLHSLMYRVAWFLLWFDQVPLFYLVALATPIASKPVQCTDLVDASESCWGEKKKLKNSSHKTKSDAFRH